VAFLVGNARKSEDIRTVIEGWIRSHFGTEEPLVHVQYVRELYVCELHMGQWQAAFTYKSIRGICIYTFFTDDIGKQDLVKVVSVTFTT
jgi:hypothetical protein